MFFVVASTWWENKRKKGKNVGKFPTTMKKGEKCLKKYREKSLQNLVGTVFDLILQKTYNFFKFFLKNYCKIKKSIVE